MERTTEFLSNMGLRFIELIGEIVVTKTEYIVYFLMILIMWRNAGILSLCYPIWVFGDALL